MTAKLLLGLAVSVLLGAGNVQAQSPSPDQDVPQIVGLFEGACMRFVGDPAGLRNWVAARQLPPVPSSQAAVFLAGVGPGQVFGASTASGKHALVSYDNGSCQAVALSANADAVRQTLLAHLVREGVAVAPVPQGSRSDGRSSQLLYRASAGQRRWLISLTSKVHADAPGMAPELHLMATIDPDLR